MIAPIKKHFNSWTHYFKNILSEERKQEYVLKEYLPLNVYEALYLRENNYINSAQYNFQFYLYRILQLQNNTLDHLYDYDYDNDYVYCDMV